MNVVGFLYSVFLVTSLVSALFLLASIFVLKKADLSISGYRRTKRILKWSFGFFVFSIFIFVFLSGKKSSYEWQYDLYKQVK